jgi:hypothetical protein
MLAKACRFLLPNWGANSRAAPQSSGKASEDGATEVWKTFDANQGETSSTDFNQLGQ